MNKSSTTEVVAGDGGAAKMQDADVVMLLNELEDIRTRAAPAIMRKRDLIQKIRFCKWPGQSDDGRKHEDDLGKRPFPFEGATDGRIRIADMIIVENTMVMAAAAARATVRVKGGDFTDEARAKKIQTLVRWQLKNNVGWSNYLREILLLANYVEGDTPAAACLGVYWEREKGLTLETLTMEQFLEALAQVTEVENPDQLTDLMEMVSSKERSDEAVLALMALVPYVTEKRARRMVKELHDTGKCEFPRQYNRLNRPRIKAERIFESVFFPTNTAEDIQRSRMIYLVESYSRAEIESMAAEEKWSKEFLDGVISNEKWSISGNIDQLEGAGDKDLNQGEPRNGLYEIITTFWRAVNDDGVLGIYMTRLHGNVKVPAGDRKLIDYKHGKYPWTFFSREVLSTRLLDSRSIAEVAQTGQETLKLLHDSFNDHTQLSTVPPVFVPQNGDDIELLIQPLGRIPRKRQGDYEYMAPPAYPQTNDQARKYVHRLIDEYHGRRNPELAPEGWVLHKQALVDRFLAGLQDAMLQLIQLCQQYMTDEEIQRVTGGNGMPVMRSAEEIQGQFDIELSFDVRDLDQKYLIDLAKTLSQWVIPLDSRQTIMRDKLVARIFAAFDPVLAEDVIRPVDDADSAEAKDEESNFTKIAAGIEPPMEKDGENFALRLEVLMGIGQKNPESYAKLTDMSREILKRRLDHLEFMTMQEKNKEIGRVGAVPVLGEG